MFGMNRTRPRSAAHGATANARAIRKLEDALAGLPPPWRVLRNRLRGSTDGPPWVKYIACHPAKGVVLIDVPPHRPDLAIAPLDEFLARTGFAAFSRGDPPIVAVIATGAAAIEDQLSKAFASAPRCGIENADWPEALIELLMSAPGLHLMPLKPSAEKAREDRQSPRDRAAEQPRADRAPSDAPTNGQRLERPQLEEEPAPALSVPADPPPRDNPPAQEPRQTVKDDPRRETPTVRIEPEIRIARKAGAADRPMTAGAPSDASARGQRSERPQKPAPSSSQPADRPPRDQPLAREPKLSFGLGSLRPEIPIARVEAKDLAAHKPRAAERPATASPSDAGMTGPRIERPQLEPAMPAASAASNRPLRNPPPTREPGLAHGTTPRRADTPTVRIDSADRFAHNSAHSRSRGPLLLAGAVSAAAIAAMLYAFLPASPWREAGSTTSDARIDAASPTTTIPAPPPAPSPQPTAGKSEAPPPPASPAPGATEKAEALSPARPAQGTAEQSKPLLPPAAETPTAASATPPDRESPAVAESNPFPPSARHEGERQNSNSARAQPMQAAKRPPKPNAPHETGEYASASPRDLVKKRAPRAGEAKLDLAPPAPAAEMVTIDGTNYVSGQEPKALGTLPASPQDTEDQMQPVVPQLQPAVVPQPPVEVFR